MHILYTFLFTNGNFVVSINAMISYLNDIDAFQDKFSLNKVGLGRHTNDLRLKKHLIPIQGYCIMFSTSTKAKYINEKRRGGTGEM